MSREVSIFGAGHDDDDDDDVKKQEVCCFLVNEIALNLDLCQLEAKVDVSHVLSRLMMIASFVVITFPTDCDPSLL
jgi:hypothetical protein